MITLKQYAEFLNISEEYLQNKRSFSDYRHALMLLCRESGMKESEIASRFGFNRSTVYSGIRKARDLLSVKDRIMRGIYFELKKFNNC
jgi:ATPase involved in DNA replication initiation